MSTFSHVRMENLSGVWWWVEKPLYTMSKREKERLKTPSVNKILNVF